MGHIGIDRSVQPINNHSKDDIVLVNSYQTITANNNNVSAESKAFADATLAKIISLVEVEEAIAA